MLWEPKSCCCGASLRTGTLVIGWLWLIGSASNIISLLGCSTFSHADLEGFCKMWINITNNDHPGSDQFYSDFCPTFASAAIGFMAVSGVGSALVLIISILLLVGVDKNKHQLMIPFLAVFTIAVALFILIGLALLILMIYIGTFIGAITVAVVWGLPSFLYVYLLLVVRACYIEVRDLGGNREVPYALQPDMSFKI